MLRRYDGLDSLHYVDPPYLADPDGESVRAKTSDRYRVEFKTEREHKLLLALLAELDGYVVLSHPRCELYEDLLGSTWEKRVKAHLTGGQEGRGTGTKVEEVLWLNPRTAAAQSQGELFDFPLKGTR